MFKFNKDFYADIRVEDKYTSSMLYRNKVLESYKTRSEKRAFIRVFDGDIWYYAATSEPTPENIQAELDGLYKQATPNPNIADNPTVKKYQVNKEVLYRFDKRSVRDVGKDAKTALLSGLFPFADNPLIKMTQIIYIDTNSNYEFYSSKGADIKYDYQLCGYMFYYAMATDVDHFQGGVQVGKPFFDELYGNENKVRDDVDRALDFVQNAKPCVKGHFPVILSPMAAGIFAHESFGHKSESDFMIGDETMAKEWVLGKKVGSDILSIADCGEAFGSGYVPFDDEGTKASKTYLIKDGILTGRLHSAFTAAVLGEEITGNARALDCKFEPIVRMTSTFIEPGDKTFEELLSGIKDGYYIHTVNHGSGETVFTLAPAISYEIKDGKLGAPVKISVVSGNVFETLGLIDGLSNNLEINSGIGGGCGKMEQFPLHVSFGGPEVRISDMNVQ